MKLPTGTVTFLLTDLEGSARLWDEYPEPMQMALARHDALLREAVEAHGGWVFKTVGDQFCVVFSRPTDALAAALEGQRALQGEPWAIGPLKARMALHTGEAEARDGDYFGPPLNRCARILAAGHGGQVLLSSATAQLIRDALPEDAELTPLGEHRLRDLAQPEEIAQLVHPALLSDFPPLRSLAAFTHNLPLQLTSFIGREEEMVEVKRLLQTARLLTLTGTGGAGKTRLALQVAGSVLDEYPDGVWLVELAALTEPSLVTGAVVSALGLREEPHRPLIDALADSLRPKRTLLILDNCEHVIGACAELAERLLRTCPQLDVLATSRDVLRAEGEVVWPVPSLSVPPQEAPHAAGAEHVADYEAVRLFADRAVAADRQFRLTHDNAAAVAEICRRLDGIPLAIELAAARVNMLTPGQIRERLHDRFGLLTGGRRTALPRHQTLQAAVGWSYSLLEDAERRLFERLSVFRGSFDLAAAQAVGERAADADLPVLDLLSGLTFKSLVVVEKGLEVRYRLLETLREYAGERLHERGHGEDVARCHAEFFMALAEEARSNFARPEQPVWLQRLDAHHDDLRAALTWALRHEPDRGAQLAGTLSHFWGVRGHWTEARNWLAQCLVEDVVLSPRPRARALIAAAELARLQADAPQAKLQAQQALALFRELDDQRGVADAFQSLAGAAWIEADHVTMRRCLEESLAICRVLGHAANLARALQNLALVAQETGDLEAARSLYEEALALNREAGGDRPSLAMALNNLGNVLLVQGDPAGAQIHHEEALAIRREMGDRAGIAMSLSCLADLAQRAGNHGASRALYEEVLATYRELGDRRVVAETLWNLADVAGAEGEVTKARALFAEGFAECQAVGAKATVLAGLGHLAVFESQRGRPAVAARLCGLVQAANERLGAPVRFYGAVSWESCLAATRDALGEEAFQAAWDAGRALTPEEAVAYALEAEPDG